MNITYISEKWICQADEFRCLEKYPTCIRSSRLCDGYDHCLNGRDEESCGEHTYFQNKVLSLY